MDKEILNPIQWAKPKGYSHLIKVKSGTDLYVAGQASFDQKGDLVGEGDFCKQYEQTINNIQVVLENGGAKLTDIVKMTIYCTDLQDLYNHRRECADIYTKYFGQYYPAVTVLEVKQLFLSGMMIEIDVVAVI